MPTPKLAGQLLLAVLFAALASAQTQSGAVSGKVTSESGVALPGAAVTLLTGGAPMTTTSDSHGGFYFWNVPAGECAIRFERSGFESIEKGGIVVDVGREGQLSATMVRSGQSGNGRIGVAAVDAARQTSGSTFDQAELQDIPTARDPWVILQQVPGVLVDRINVGGSESGQQDNYVGKGTDPTQNAWNVDGVTVTDMASTGSSPTYYDFDAFQEMQATTGGSDPSIAVPGVTLNMVTRRGTNEVHGSARVMDTPHQMEAYNIPDEAKAQGLTRTNRVDNIQDYGVEAGGPVWPDKAWLWGSYGRDQLNFLETTGTFNRTALENVAAKLNVQPVASNSFTLFYFRGETSALGLDSGFTRPQPTSLDESAPTTIWKGEDSQVFASNLVFDVAWNFVSADFNLTPEGGIAVDATQDASGVWHNSYQYTRIDRPQHQVNASASRYFNTGSIGHEVKFGFGYRNALTHSFVAWPGSGNVDLGAYGIAMLTRPKNLSISTYYYSGYLADTISVNNLTINAGLRYDDQYGNNNPSTSPADPTFPTLLPALNYPGDDKPFTWRNWEPRVGLTYALGADKKTLLRASYARFADQLGAPVLSHNNPEGYQYLYYAFDDLNHNGIVDPGELAGFYSANGVDPNCPAACFFSGKTDPNLRAPTTDEFMLGIDHEILPNFVAGLTYTYRERKNLLSDALLGPDGNPLTSADYKQISAGLTGYDAFGNRIGTTGPIYDVAGGYEGSFNTLLHNNGGYRTTYRGLELQMVKRLSDHWMAHASFTWADWKQEFDGRAACGDPTDTLGTNGGTCDNGAAWFGGATNSGSVGNVYINSKWALNLNGLYQLPMNFDVSANFFGRQGYLLPYYYRIGTSTGSKNVLIQTGDDSRNANVYELDLRLAKVIPLFQKADLRLSVDLFNAFNENTILQKRLQTGADGSGSAQANRITEVQAPRILRFGARVTF